MPKKSKESLAEWVIRTTPGLTEPAPAAKQITKVSAKALAVDAPAKIPVTGPRWVKLKDWAHLMFGEQIPHVHTLRRWVHEGLIQPPPKKIGKTYYVKPDAEYRE
jgi:hypothetical protein